VRPPLGSLPFTPFGRGGRLAYADTPRAAAERQGVGQGEITQGATSPTSTQCRPPARLTLFDKPVYCLTSIGASITSRRHIGPKAKSRTRPQPRTSWQHNRKSHFRPGSTESHLLLRDANARLACRGYTVRSIRARGTNRKTATSDPVM